MSKKACDKIAAGLDELLAGITEENLHGEVRTGPAVGNEALEIERVSRDQDEPDHQENR